MNENIDLAIVELKESIINVINEAQMPPSIIYYVLKDIYEELASAYQVFLKQQKEKVAEAAADEKQTQVKEQVTNG